jgi:hypothetical protein
MSENWEEGITPSEAARILAGRRWKEDEQPRWHHDQPAEPEGPEYYGKEATERGQGFSEMPLANPISKESDAPIDSSQLLRPDQEAPAAEPVPIQYMQQGGEKAGQPMDPRLTVSPEQAASDLSRWRENIGEQIEALEAKQLADAIDQLRAGEQPQLPQPELHPNDVTAAAAEAQTSPVDPVARALQDPAVLSAVQAEVQRHSAAAEQARLSYEAGLAQNAAAAAYALIQSFEELQGVRPDQIPTAIQVVAKQNPQRAEQMVRHIDQVGRLVEQHQKLQVANYVAQQQETQRQWQSYAVAQDADYTAFEKTRPEAEVKAVRENVLRVLSSTYGLPEADFMRAYQTNPVARSAAMQRMAYDLTAAQLAREGIAAKAVPPQVPKVVRPGSPVERVPDSEASLHKLAAKLNQSHSVKDAAAYLAARRRAGG